jgi:hypothetical protein
VYTKATCLRKAFRWLPVVRHRIGNTVNSVSFLHRQSSLYKHGESWLRKFDRVVEKFHANGFVHGDLRLSNITVPCTTVYGSPRSHARNGTKFRLGAPVLTCSSQCSSFFSFSLLLHPPYSTAATASCSTTSTLQAATQGETTSQPQSQSQCFPFHLSFSLHLSSRLTPSDNT